MAITTYSELKDRVLTWMDRSDLSGDAAEFISLAESRLNRKLPLREMWETTELTGVVDSRDLTLPSDYLEPSFLKLTTYTDPKFLTPQTPDAMVVYGTSGEPEAWAIDAATIKLNRPCDQAHTFDFRYRKKFALSDTEPTNWLLTEHPDVYLAAVLVWGGFFVKDIAGAAPWKQVLDEAIEELAWIEARGASQAVLAVDPALVGRGRFNINVG